MKNEPAFPTITYDERVNGIGHYTDNSGMTLLDYFAAKAMNGMLSNESHYRNNGEGEAPTGITPDQAAQMSYQFAVAMLAEREKYLNPVS